MTIRKKIQIIIWILVIVTGVLGFMLNQKIRSIRASDAKTDLSNKVSSMVLNRRLVGDDYMLHSRERSKEQWYIAQEDLETLIDEQEDEFSRPEEKELIKDLKESFARSRIIFTDLVALNEADSDSALNKEERLKIIQSELTLKAQETVLYASRLYEVNKQYSVRQFNLFMITFSVLCGIYGLLLLSSLWIIWASAKKLAMSEAKNRAILSGIGDAVFAVNAEKNITLFNKVASALSGYKESEALGKPYDSVLKFIDEKTNLPKNDFISTALRGKTNNMSNATTLIAKSGASIAVGDSAAPYLDEKGKVVGAVVVFRDVTKERQIENAKDEFISLASHQLRTPLTAIRLYTEMIQDHKDISTPQREEYMEVIHQSTLRMIKLVGDILNVSRIQLGSLKIDPVATQLSQLIEDTVNEIRPVAAIKKISLNFQAQKNIPNVSVDVSITRQVVHNLLTNAVRYSNDNGKIEVRLRRTTGKEKPPGYLISVKDMGIGIPKQDQEKIFTRFFRSENAIRKEGDGTGLGMYMAKMIMDLTGGKIWFESQENKGTTFYVIIPTKGMIKKTGTKSLS